MEGMNIIGKLFDNGKIFTSQILRVVGIIKLTITSLTPLIKSKGTKIQRSDNNGNSKR